VSGEDPKRYREKEEKKKITFEVVFKRWSIWRKKETWELDIGLRQHLLRDKCCCMLES
jgi:hypothetical protein